MSAAPRGSEEVLEPEDVVPEWKRWSPILLRPEGLYGTRPAEGGNKAAKLRAIREALRTAKRVWLATDCDRGASLLMWSAHWRSAQRRATLVLNNDSGVERPAQSKADAGMPIVGASSVALRRAQAARGDPPSAAADHTNATICGCPSRAVRGCARIIGVPAILKPLERIAVHVVQCERVR
jgi:DNA topoisomerase III